MKDLPTIKRTGTNCRCIFFPISKIPYYSMDVSATLGGLTGTLQSLQEAFEEMGGAFYILKEGVEICLPPQIDSDFSNTLIVSGIPSVSNWINFPEFEFFNQIVCKLSLSFDYISSKNTNQQLTFRFTDKGDLKVHLNDIDSEETFKRSILWHFGEALSNSFCSISEDLSEIEITAYAGDPNIPYEVVIDCNEYQDTPLSLKLKTHFVQKWDNKEGKWRRNGGPVTSNDIAWNTRAFGPYCLTPTGQPLNKLPPIIIADEEGEEQGSFFAPDEDNEPMLELADVVLKWKTYGDKLYTQYLHQGEVVQIPYGAYFGHAHTCEPFTVIDTDKLASKTHKYLYVEKSAIIRPLEPIKNQAKVFAAETLDGYICMVIEGYFPFYSDSPLINGVDNKHFKLKNNLIRINTWSQPNSKSLKIEIFLNEEVKIIDGDVKDLLLSFDTECEFYVKATYLSPVSTEINLLTDETYYTDQWAFDDITEPYDGAEPYLFTSILSKSDPISEHTYFSGTINEPRRKEELKEPVFKTLKGEMVGEKLHETSSSTTYFSQIKEEIQDTDIKYKFYEFCPTDDWLKKQVMIRNTLSQCKSVFEDSKKAYGSITSAKLQSMEVVQAKLNVLKILVKELDTDLFKYIEFEQKDLEKKYRRISEESHKFLVKTIIRKIITVLEPKLMRKPLQKGTILKINPNRPNRQLFKGPDHVDFACIGGINLDNNWREIAHA
jgi:hypothetical protein